MTSKNEILEKLQTFFEKAPFQIPQENCYRQSVCPGCSGNNLFRFLMVNENRFRPNGVEIDRDDFSFYCWDCKTIFEDNEKWQTTYLIARSPEAANEETLLKLLQALESNSMVVEQI